MFKLYMFYAFHFQKSSKKKVRFFDDGNLKKDKTIDASTATSREVRTVLHN